MEYPKLNSNIEYETFLPGLNRTVKYRPFLIAEQKILLQAMESDDPKQVATSLRQVFDRCVTDDLTSNDTPIFDFEYLFVRMRAVSVNDVVPILIGHHPDEDTDCTNQTKHEIKLNDVIIDGVPPNRLIELNDSLGVKMRYPTAEYASRDRINLDEIEASIRIIAENMECIYEINGDRVWQTNDVKKNIEWLENELSDVNYIKIRKFFENLPRIGINFTVTCSACGSKRDVRLRGLSDFFL